MNIRKIEPFDYLKGSDFTENLKRLTGCKNFQEMAFVYDVPKSTFSTWNTHDRTSHELMVRAHLALGIPMADLALKPEDRKNLPGSKGEPRVASGSHTQTERNPQLSARTVKSYCLTSGKLLETGVVPVSERRLNSFGLEHSELIEIETNQSVVLIDKNENDPINGHYLIGIDGRYSINHVLRLPDALSVTFEGNITKELKESDIEVKGKVVLETRLK